MAFLVKLRVLSIDLCAIVCKGFCVKVSHGCIVTSSKQPGQRHASTQVGISERNKAGDRQLHVTRFAVCDDLSLPIVVEHNGGFCSYVSTIHNQKHKNHELCDTNI
jgi:hypothetical protein